MGNDVQDEVLRPKGNFIVSSMWIYKNKYTKQGLWFLSKRGSRLWKDILQCLDKLARWYNQSRMEDQSTYKNWDSLQRLSCAQKYLYKIRRNPWNRTYSYMRSLRITQSDGDLNLCYKVEDGILQRMRSSQMGARGNCNKVLDGRYWYLVTMIMTDRFLCY